MVTDTVPRHTHHASPVHEPPAAIRATGIVVVITVALAILAIAFGLPAARSKPHDVPVGAAGPQAASGQVADMLEQHSPGAFAITYYPGASSSWLVTAYVDDIISMGVEIKSTRRYAPNKRLIQHRMKRNRP